MSTPYPESSSPWVTREGDPALASDYRATIGYQPYAYASHWGVKGDAAKHAYTDITSAPVYTYKALDSMWGKGPEQVYQTNDILYRLGYMSASVAGRNFWSKEADTALRKAMADANRSGITLEQALLARMRDGSGSGAPGSYRGGGGGGGRSVSTSTSVNLTSKEAAQQILAQSLAQQLGRQPTASETAAFLRSLNATERANPSTSTTVSTAGHSSTTSKSVNINPSAEADTWVKNNKALATERAGYQGAMYYDVIAKMLGV